MMMHPPRRLANLYLVICLLAWIPMGARAVVLCLEPGGRVVFEEGGACCAPSATYSAGGVASQGLDDPPDDCGPCVDIHFDGPAGHIVPGRNTVPRPLPVSPAIAVPSRLVAARLTSHTTGVGHSPHERPTGPPTRTVILRN